MKRVEINEKKKSRTTLKGSMPKESNKGELVATPRKVGLVRATRKDAESKEKGRVVSTKIPPVSQAGKARMGRPESKEVHAAYAAETKRLMTAIKEGAGKLSNRRIEEGLGIGRDKTGAYSGRYFSRYLNVDGAVVKAALPPDRLSQIAEKARALGWLPVEKREKGLIHRQPYRHLDVPDGALLSEKIQQVVAERESLLKAQNDAVAALTTLQATMTSCEQIGFMYTIKDSNDDVATVFDGIYIDLGEVIRRISEAFIFNEDFIGSSIFEEVMSRKKIKRKK